MKKTLLILPLLVLTLSPRFLNALTNEEKEGRYEIEQGWVDRHNEKLVQPVKDAVKRIKAKKHSFFGASRKRHIVRMKRINFRYASENKVPLTLPFPSATPVPLAALYQAKAAGFSFLIADYEDDYDALHSQSDIYIKIGLIYRHLFHGQGYRGCARILTLGKTSPLFFEMGQFGGGTNFKKTIQTLDVEAVKGMSQDLYDHPENVVPETYVKEVLEFNIWLEGYTFYKDVEKNGSLEIVNLSRVEYPEDLKKKLQEKYRQEDNEFGGSFRKVASVYKWDASKTKFIDLGDYYFGKGGRSEE